MHRTHCLWSQSLKRGWTGLLRLTFSTSSKSFSSISGKSMLWEGSMMACILAIWLVILWNGVLPYVILYKIHPRDQTSPFGLIYSGKRKTVIMQSRNDRWVCWKTLQEDLGACFSWLRWSISDDLWRHVVYGSSLYEGKQNHFLKKLKKKNIQDSHFSHCMYKAISMYCAFDLWLKITQKRPEFYRRVLHDTCDIWLNSVCDPKVDQLQRSVYDDKICRLQVTVDDSCAAQIFWN